MLLGQLNLLIYIIKLQWVGLLDIIVGSLINKTYNMQYRTLIYFMSRVENQRMHQFSLEDSDRRTSTGQTQFSQESQGSLEMEKNHVAMHKIILTVMALTFMFLMWFAYDNINHEKRQNNSQRQIISGAHSSDCYTQGLSFINTTHVLESCGLFGQSYFQILQYSSSPPSLSLKFKSSIFPSHIFLEGSTYFPKDKVIYILTWRQNTIYRINSKNYQIMGAIPWRFEGWGLTHNNSHLFVSDGSDRIYVVDQNFIIFEEIKIIDEYGKSLKNLNQLQWGQDNGKQYIYANVFLNSVIVKIELESGKVVKTIRQDHLVYFQGNRRMGEVLNGIAVIPNQELFMVTGKKWNHFFIEKFNLE